jgi:hypothetical protein
MYDIDADLHEGTLAAVRSWADKRLKEGMPPIPLAVAMLSVAVSTGLTQDGPYVRAQLLRWMADRLERGGIAPLDMGEERLPSLHLH